MNIFVNINDIKLKLDLFLQTYDQYERDTYWISKSEKFKVFWNQRIMPNDNNKLDQLELEETIRLLDMKGLKGRIIKHKRHYVKLL